MIKDKKNIVIALGIILVFIGSVVPSIRIATENISFIKENGIIIIILMAVMAILLKLEKTEIISVPSILSLILIIKFIIDNKINLKKINAIYHCEAVFKYGTTIMILGNLLILITLVMPKINIEKIRKNIKEYIEKIKERIKTFKKPKQITPSIIEKLEKKENKNKITRGKTADGQIKFSKIVVNVENITKNKSIKEKIKDIIFKLKIKKISKKKLSITKYKEEKPIPKRTYYIQTIDIKKWTRDNVSCINCGAKVSSNSEYCFLCDCKIKLNDKEKKLS